MPTHPIPKHEYTVKNQFDEVVGYFQWSDDSTPPFFVYLDEHREMSYYGPMDGPPADPFILSCGQPPSECGNVELSTDPNGATIIFDGMGARMPMEY